MRRSPTVLGGVLVGFAALWHILPFAYRLYGEYRLRHLCQERRTIVLSYDDGPGAELTPRLLGLLSRHSVLATFFVMGRNAEDRPDLVRRLVEAGHEVGSHTYAHTNAWRALPARVADDVDAGMAVVAHQGGDSRLFRPPYGKLTLAGLMGGRRRGLRYGWWTIDSGDSWARRPISEVIDEVEAKRGGVVLMHDSDRYEDAIDGVSHIEHVLSLTESIIEFANGHGYRLRTLHGLDSDGELN